MKTLISFFCLVTYLTCALSANGWPISLDMACNEALSAVACSFEFTNNGNEDLYLLKRNTPLEGLNSPFISVYLDGRPLKYKGIYAFYLSPTKDEFVLLKAGESMSVSVQVTDAFNIDADGLYTVQYSRPVQYLSVKEMSRMSIEKLKESFVHKSVQIRLQDTRLLFKPTSSQEKGKSEPKVYTQTCTSSAKFINGDRKNSETLEAHKKICTTGAFKAISHVSENSDYDTWFSTYSSENGETVKGILDRLQTVLERKEVEYVNDGPLCKSNMLAYSDETGISSGVFFCDSYYDLPVKCDGTKVTKELVLVSFNINALFGRYKCYRLKFDAPMDPEEAKKLALYNPLLSTYGCDNLAFFYCASQ
ncbi:PREDICTED: uncharacterized protein LOC105314175 [Amphimedon queenslandica]|uniref:Lysine-specific metallo-endopeptidase domain-containing protein n=1 Tax=Amphimedon queenslandica TaxID=400682 RepID=A0A1X7TYH9_AMPQE|nr:PREDICTED: uncharacterized protein LOC105314175 [Amphimedon queenslandica]|eukprot:XP_011406478.2 PREDICTED: uncharacterized protein LOC105314175 [Amphimedon queenslandica]